MIQNLYNVSDEIYRIYSKYSWDCAASPCDPLYINSRMCFRFCSLARAEHGVLTNVIIKIVQHKPYGYGQYTALFCEINEFHLSLRLI